ncbi:hypothetical protein COO91_10632 (plasmid) [Nostoc flagelliforme CCNUN1]|uniref:Uncharacterized protein n=1 Tax=Nostoc flagelliforme CCNUN1 TaxID=2038116 RepID=A0A2K8T9S3_9NOSO|nr:hypothetical protein COO91_10632 [Nostoc flagelliforme CCNUN1]
MKKNSAILNSSSIFSEGRYHLVKIVSLGLLAELPLLLLPVTKLKA